MTTYEVHVTEIASGYTLIDADSPEQARKKYEQGDFDPEAYRDLGHDSPVIHDIVERKSS